MSATVGGDPANAGVDWVPMCGGGAAGCGTFSPSHTASGAATTFTAPNGVPVGGTVALTALSTTDKGKASAATVTITSNVTAVVITPPLPAVFPAGGSLNVTAYVGGDPSKLGVDWKATCGTINCTSAFLGTHSAPGVPATFVVPLPSVNPTIVGSIVTVTAFATADHSFSTSATFIVVDPVSISITQAPPTTMPTNASVPMIATVTNDPTNSGVTWTITLCDAAPCGSWSASSPNVLSTQVTSGGTATYTAPGTARNRVVLQAAATASPQNAFATVEISVTAPVTIAITQGVPNNTIVKNATAPVIATVSNDAANAGVDWTATCGSTGACGSFVPTHTASGAATTFTAPGAVPTGNTVAITATATSDNSKTASETVTVTQGAAPDSLLMHQWIMLLTGKDANGGPYVLGGVIAGDGIGTITSGTLDVADLGSGASHNANTVHLAATPKSTYSIGTDGRGQINLTLDTSNLNGCFGVNGCNGIGSITLSVVFVSTNHAVVSETDTFGSGTGTLDLQNATDLSAFENGKSGLNGSYTLNLTGAEVSGSNPPYFLAGAVSFVSSGTSYTETSYTTDQSDQGVVHSAPHTAVSIPFIGAAPPASGEISLAMNLGVPPMQFNLDLWLIDANHFVVTDVRDLFFVTPSVIISGRMVAQPASPAISGTYAFTESARTASPTLTPQSAGGIFTCGSTGVLDVTALGGTPVSNAPVNVACTPPALGRGLITVSGTGTTGTGISRFAAYPTVDQSLHLIELDGGSAGTSGPSGSGVARSVTLSSPILPSAFSGKYAANFLASTPLGLEGFAGQIDPDGVSMISGLAADVNSFNVTAPPVGAPSLNATLSGSFTAAPNGRLPLVLKIAPATGQPTPEFTNLNPVCYVLDASTCLLVGVDVNAVGTGILELQNTGL